MIKPYQFIVNGNGDNAATLLEQYKKAVKAVYTAQQLLCESRPHGRNYQTIADPEVYRADSAQWEADITALNDMIFRLEASARRAYEMKR